MHPIEWIWNFVADKLSGNKKLNDEVHDLIMTSSTYNEIFYKIINSRLMRYDDALETIHALYLYCSSTTYDFSNGCFNLDEAFSHLTQFYDLYSEDILNSDI